MNEIEPLSAADDVASAWPLAEHEAPAGRAAPASQTRAPMPELAPATPASPGADGAAPGPHPGVDNRLRRDRLWNVMKDKAGDILDRMTATGPDSGGADASRMASTPLKEEEWSAVSRPQVGDGMPPSLNKRYFIAENKFYFRDKTQALAFEDRGTRLVTVHNDPEVARAMVELAQAKDWTTLRLKGSDEFKREAWLAASLRGLDVRGYRPTELDKARLAAELDQPQRANVIEPGREHGADHDAASGGKPNSDILQRPDPAPTDSTAPLARQTAIQALERLLRARGDSEQAISMTTEIAAEQLRQRRVFVGKLLNHGPARFDNKPINEHSYFVHLDTGSGEKTLWGVDLERAIASSGAQRGDDIVIAQPDSRQVTVPQLIRDGDGHPTGEKILINAKRNDWVIRTVDGLRDAVAERTSPAPTPPRETQQETLRPLPMPVKSGPRRPDDRDGQREIDYPPFER